MESAGAEAATRGNDAGRASQIRPQAVSVWVGGPLGTTGDGVEPPGTGVSSVLGEEMVAADAAGDRGAVAAGVGTTLLPLHAAAITRAARRPLNGEAMPQEWRLGSVMGPS
jgi:hypothetical protein